jgi:hypothetical protein
MLIKMAPRIPVIQTSVSLSPHLRLPNLVMSDLVAIATTCVRVPCAETARASQVGTLFIARAATVTMVTVASSIRAHRLRAWTARVRWVVRASSAHARTIPPAFSATKRAPIAFVKMAGNVEFLAGNSRVHANLVGRASIAIQLYHVEMTMTMIICR